MIEAMIGRRMAEVGRPAPLDARASDAEPVLELAGRPDWARASTMCATAHGR